MNAFVVVVYYAKQWIIIENKITLQRPWNGFRMGSASGKWNGMSESIFKILKLMLKMIMRWKSM